MEDILISYDTAKLAKQKGVNYPCNKVYVIYNKDVSSYHPHKKEEIPIFEKGEIRCISSYDIESYNIEIGKAYTQSLLQKYLRIKHRILIEIKPVDDWDNWTYDIYLEDIMSPFFKANPNMFEYDDYDHCFEMALQEALTYIK